MSRNIYHFIIRYADGSIKEFNARLVGESLSRDGFDLTFEPVNEPADSGTMLLEKSSWRAS